MKEGITYVGLDVHQKFIQVAMLAPGHEDAVEWRTPNTAEKVRALAKKVRRLTSGEVSLCYEAGPTGYTTARILNAEPGFTCRVIAPSLIPQKPGERIKTDRRDAKKLANYLRAGLLTEVRAPSPEDEARRELSRARGAAKDDEKRAKQRLSKFLLRHGRIYREGKKPWTGQHMGWLNRQRFDDPLLQMVFDDLLRALEHARDRVRGLDDAIEEAATDEAVWEQVGILRCFKGIDTTTAMSVVSELYSFERFESPRSLMAFLGMTPSEHSSAGETNRGGITKAGNSRLRKLLIEAAWHYTRSARVGYPLAKRREDQPGWAVDIADKALHRLHRRYWRLTARGKIPTKAVMAVARELVGFIWAALTYHRLQEAHA